MSGTEESSGVSATEPVFSNNPDELRYEAVRDGALVGEIGYVADLGRIVLVHTQVASSEKGTGVGSFLVRSALDDIRRRGLQVTPVCPFVSAYIKRHPEYGDLVSQDHGSGG